MESQLLGEKGKGGFEEVTFEEADETYENLFQKVVLRPQEAISNGLLWWEHWLSFATDLGFGQSTARKRSKDAANCQLKFP